jgi:hypothetical protein
MVPPGGGKKDGFALLIGKRLAGKGKPGADEPDGDEGPPESMDGSGDGKQEEMEDSAIADFMAAKDPSSAKAALKDFLELCYPSLGGGDGPESEEEMPPAGADEGV